MSDRTAFMILICVIFLAFITITVAFGISNAQAERYQVCVVDADGGLNVREGPGVEFRTSFILSDRAEVVIIEAQDNWALVNSRTLINKREPFGWVCTDYLIKYYEVEIE